jgi:hypothetical protein
LKNGAGVIVPSRLNTIPFFRTNRTSRSTSMSWSGSPRTAIRSAARPGRIGPRVRSVSLTRYPLTVIARRMSTGGMPAAVHVSRNAIATSPRVLPGTQ